MVERWLPTRGGRQESGDGLFRAGLSAPRLGAEGVEDEGDGGGESLEDVEALFSRR